MGTPGHIRAALAADATRAEILLVLKMASLLAIHSCSLGAHAAGMDPVWTEFMATGGSIDGSGVFTPKEVELLSIAFDASYTHMYAPGTRRHINSALAVGATRRNHGGS